MDNLKPVSFRKQFTNKNRKLTGRSIYLLPNFFTTGSLFAGFYAIVQAMNGRFDNVAIAIFIAVIMDMLDGRIARMTNTESEFGAEYDSLSDMVSFGVAPALILYVWSLKALGKLGWVAAFVYCISAALRLARFNTKHDTGDKKWFEGLPSPAAAMLLMGFIWLLQENDLDGHALLFGYIPAVWISWALTLFSGVSMVSNMPYYSGKEINLRRSVSFVFLVLLVSAFILILLRPEVILFAIFMLYALSGYVRWLQLRQREKQSVHYGEF